MCSQASNSNRNNIHEFNYTLDWHTSEEAEDTDDSDNLNLGRMGRCMSQPEPSVWEKAATSIKRAKSEETVRSSEYSFQKKKKDWHRSSVVNSDAELRAKRYSSLVMDDTLKHLSQTIHTAGSIVEKGAAINNELARQESVLSKAETDILVAEYETEQVTHTLKGMRSLRGKLKNVIWKKEPKLKISEFDNKRSTFSNMNLDLLKDDVGLCSFSSTMQCQSSLSKEITEDIQQIKFKEGMGQLHKALDIMAVQQREAAWALDSHEERLSMFENNVATTNSKINSQSQMISSIIGKS